MDVSLAQLLDVARPLIMSSLQSGETPRFLAVHPALYDAVADCKKADVSRGQRLLVLGLELVPSDAVSLQSPKVIA